MKQITLPLIVASFLILQANAASTLHFSASPVLEHFPDGSVEWSATLSCTDPSSLSGVRVLFSFDSDLDGVADGARDSIVVSSATCENGQARLSRTFFPSSPASLTAELWQGVVLSDHPSAFTGSLGTLLSILRFCARPTNGEPEWVELRNTSSGRINLSKVRIEGHLLKGTLDGGATVLVGRDSNDLLNWQPGANIMTTTSWSSLRNTGDTVHVTWDNTVALDSLVYGAAVDSHEGCASAPTEENVAAASGFAMDLSKMRWNPRTEFLSINIQAPISSEYDLRVFDLDGFELCAIAKNKAGPAKIQFSGSDCNGLRGKTGSILLQLRPQSSAPLRKIIRILGP